MRSTRLIGMLSWIGCVVSVAAPSALGADAACCCKVEDASAAAPAAELEILPPWPQSNVLPLVQALPLPAWGEVQAFDLISQGTGLGVLLAQRQEPGEKAQCVRVSLRPEGSTAWSPLVELPQDEQPSAAMNGGNAPRLAWRGNLVAAVWPGGGDGPMRSGDLLLAVSADGGKSWTRRSAPALPAGVTPTAPVGQRFPALTLGPAGLHVVWIHASAKVRSLLAAHWPQGAASWNPTVVVDEEICACCWNRLTVTPKGDLVAVYRDQHPSDMSTAWSSDGGASWRVTPAIDRAGWVFNGCPHVGAGLAVGPQGQLAATTWSGSAERGGVYALTAAPHQAWNAPRRLGFANAKHTDVAISSDGVIAQVWDAFDPQTQRWRVWVQLVRDGVASPPMPLSTTEAPTQFPRVVAVGAGFVCAWLESGEQTSTLQAARVAWPTAWPLPRQAQRN